MLLGGGLGLFIDFGFNLTLNYLLEMYVELIHLHVSTHAYVAVGRAQSSIGSLSRRLWIISSF